MLGNPYSVIISPYWFHALADSICDMMPRRLVHLMLEIATKVMMKKLEEKKEQ